MMTETMYDPYETFFSDEQNSLTPDGLLFSNEVMFTDFNTDSSSISPIPTTLDNTGSYIYILNILYLYALTSLISRR